MKKVYQIVGSFNDSVISDFLYKEFNARFIYNHCYWFESELTPKEISEKIKQSISEEDKLKNTWYILELTNEIEGWMGSTHIGWIREKLDFDNENE